MWAEAAAPAIRLPTDLTLSAWVNGSEQACSDCLAGIATGCQDVSMNEQLTPEDIRRLSVAERLRLIEDVWASLSETPETVAVPEWHRAELDERLAAHDRDPTAARPWDEAKTDIRSALRK